MVLLGAEFQKPIPMQGCEGHTEKQRDKDQWKEWGTECFLPAPPTYKKPIFCPLPDTGPAARAQSVASHTDLIVGSSPFIKGRAHLHTTSNGWEETRPLAFDRSHWTYRMVSTSRWMTFSHNPDNTMVFGVSSKIIKCNLFILSLPNSCLLFLLFKQRFFLELTGLNLVILLPLPPEFSDSKQASLCTLLNSCLLI